MDLAASETEPEPVPDPDNTIPIAAGDDALAVVASADAGTSFLFETGVHRLEEQIQPRDGDVFRGEAGAVLSGTRILTGATRDGGLWSIEGQTQEGWRHGECRDGSPPRCPYPEELFLDEEGIKRVATRWHFDYGTDTAYLADKPTGRRLEFSVASAAIAGDAHDLSLCDLTIETFASAAQGGAIMVDRIASTKTYGRHWTIVDNTVRWNHGVGIRAGSGALIARNEIQSNDQLGLSSVSEAGTSIDGNVIEYNNAAGFRNGWESGGTKIRAD